MKKEIDRKPQIKLLENVDDPIISNGIKYQEA
jgi:hypothetical protein